MWCPSLPLSLRHSHLLRHSRPLPCERFSILPFSLSLFRQPILSQQGPNTIGSSSLLYLGSGRGGSGSGLGRSSSVMVRQTVAARESSFNRKRRVSQQSRDRQKHMSYNTQTNQSINQSRVHVRGRNVCATRQTRREEEEGGEVNLND
jgi:hypothetical protein